MRPLLARRWVPVAVCAAMLLIAAVVALTQEPDPGAADPTGPTAPSSAAPSTTVPGQSSAATTPPSSAATSQPAATPSTPAPETDTLSATERREVRRAAGARGAAQAFADVVQKHRRSSPGRFMDSAAPLLSDLGRTQFAGRGPSAAGFTRRTGPARILLADVSPGDRFVSIVVPTNAGHALLLMERVEGSWLVSSVSQLTGAQR